MAVIGFASGLLHTAMFQAISPVYRHDPVATVNLAGLLFGLGCLAVALLISGAFYAYSAATLQAWIAAIPALFGWICVKTRFPKRATPPTPAASEILLEVRSPAAVLGGYLIGMFESLVKGYLAPGYGDAITFALLLVVLFLQREGLLHGAQRRRV